MKRLPLTEDNYRLVIRGRKTQTRRVAGKRGPAYAVGDVVGVTLPHWRTDVDNTKYVYDAVTGVERDQRHQTGKWTIDQFIQDSSGWRRMPAMLMPAWACLHFVEITAVRKQRLQEISPADVFAEGIGTSVVANPHEDFLRVWNSIHGYFGGCAWADNPEVCAYTFRLTERPHG